MNTTKEQTMSLYNGLLLFDVAEAPINGWEENLGTRGYFQQWRKGPLTLNIEIDDDSLIEGEYETYWQNEETGSWDWIAGGTFKQCKRAAVRFMNRR
jgi:hypothetical protein